MADQIISKIHQVTDADGRTHIEQVTVFKKKGNEPAFVKMYLEFAAHLRFLNARERDVLSELLIRMDYENKVSIPGAVRKEICRSIELYRRHKVDRWSGKEEYAFDEQGRRLPSVNALNGHIKKLADHNVISRLGPGLYLVNPQLFGKGKWLDIQEIRVSTAKSFEDLRKSALPKPKKKLPSSKS